MDDAPIDDEGEIISEFIDVDPFEDERQARLWLRSCALFVESMTNARKDGMEGATHTAINEAVRAACDRAARILHADRIPIDDDGFGRDG